MAVKHYCWSAIGKISTELLAFVGNILIARILSPGDYGLIAMLSIIMALSLTFSEAGFNDFLIRKKDSDRIDFGTVATYNIGVSIILYVLIYFTAPLVAVFFNRQELVPIARLLGLSIILKSFTLSGFVQLTKELKFKESSFINIFCSLLSILSTYIMAKLGCGYWSLVMQQIFVAFYNILLLIIIGKWRPYFCFNKGRFVEMFKYSSNLLVSYIINTIGKNCYSFVIGKNYTNNDLGFYNQAQRMQTVPTQGLNNIILTTSYPLIAKETDTNLRYSLYVNLFNRFNFVQTWLVFALITIAEFVFLVLLGEKWLPSSDLFKLFMLLSLTYPLVTINANIVKLNGCSATYRTLTFIRTLMQVLSLLICAKFSLYVIIIGQIIASFCSAFIDMYVCGKLIGFNLNKQLNLWLGILFKPLVSYMLTVLCLLFVNLGQYESLISFVIYNVLFLLICIFTRDVNYIYVVQLLKGLLYEKIVQ